MKKINTENPVIVGIIFNIVILVLFLKNESPQIIVFSILTPLIFLISFNFEMMIKSLLFISMVSIPIFFFSASEFMIPILVISFFITNEFRLKYFFNRYIKCFSIFLISLIPSYINSIGYWQPFIKIYHLIVFIIIIGIIPIYLDTEIKIYKIINAFLLFVFLNSVYVIYLGVTTGERVFGYTGIVFVDLAGIAITISYYNILVEKRTILNIFLALIFLTALIYTQTRNTLITTILLILFISFHYIRKHSFYYDSLKKSILKISVIISIIIGIFLSAVFISPETFNRMKTSDDKVTADELATGAELISSFASRYFIWHTAWNAFKENPICGVGLYNFPHVSKTYNTFDNFIYKEYIEELPPHQTIIALLCETGVIGLLGFIIFISKLLKNMSTSRKNKTHKEKYILYSIIFYSNLYILLSMLMTDIWLGASGIVIWAIFVSLGMSGDNIFAKDNK